jgi:hypothetical protein
MTNSHTRCILAWFMALTILGPATAEAANPARVGIEVTVIHAMKDGAGVDTRLKPIARYLKSSFKDFKRFEHLRLFTDSTALNGAVQVELPTRNPLKLSYLSYEDGFITLRLQHGSLDTRVRVKDGGLFFQAGRGYRGGILVLAIRASATGR